MKSYKVHKNIYNPQDEWQVFENTQEPIITQETFDLVQELRKHKRRPQKMQTVNPFVGMVYCADCGEKMYLSRRKNERPEQEHMRCSTYAKEQDKCTVHYIRTCVLNEIVLGELNKLLAMVKGNEEDFAQRVMSSSIQQKSSELTKAKKALKQAEKRIAELDKLFTRLYEDNVLGRLSDERFTMMSAGYEDEQQKLKATAARLTALIDTAEQKSSDVNAFLDVIRKYEHISIISCERWLFYGGGFDGYLLSSEFGILSCHSHLSFLLYNLDSGLVFIEPSFSGDVPLNSEIMNGVHNLMKEPYFYRFNLYLLKPENFICHNMPILYNRILLWHGGILSIHSVIPKYLSSEALLTSILPFLPAPALT